MRFLVLFAALLAAAGSHGQTYPSKPVRMIVPFE
jgi:tripartite-type tricarboxylate transporter receptor subunit TctC